jgi:hypothetical protein
MPWMGWYNPQQQPRQFHYGNGKGDPPPDWDGQNPDETFPPFERMYGIWQMTTTTPPDMRGREVLKGLKGTAKNAVWATITDAELVSDTGAERILQILREA